MADIVQGFSFAGKAVARRLKSLSTMRVSMTSQPDLAGFEATMLCYLDEAVNLAGWILHDQTAAQDAVQDAMLRALKYFPSFRGTNARAWLLQIVRNVAYGVLKRNAGVQFVPLLDEHDEALKKIGVELVAPSDDPEVALSRVQDRRTLDRLLATLPVEQRECLILKELDDMSYQEIAEITETPIGTVMSRLWRARQALMRAAERSRLAS